MDQNTLGYTSPRPYTTAWGARFAILRLSVTDPLQSSVQVLYARDDYAWLPRDTILTFEGRWPNSPRSSAELGVDKVRLTSGEPLLRRDLPRFVRQICLKIAGSSEIALTSNGVLAADQAADLSLPD